MPNSIHESRFTLFRDAHESAPGKKLLQSDVAQKLKKNQSFVSKYERGERRLDFPEFLLVADALGINVTGFIKRHRMALTKIR
jgi:transcriptional regulator with XRE-family HTH domain